MPDNTIVVVREPDTPRWAVIELPPRRHGLAQTADQHPFPLVLRGWHGLLREFGLASAAKRTWIYIALVYDHTVEESHPEPPELDPVRLDLLAELLAHGSLGRTGPRAPSFSTSVFKTGNWSTVAVCGRSACSSSANPLVMKAS